MSTHVIRRASRMATGLCSCTVRSTTAPVVRTTFMISKCRCPTARFVSPSFEHFELLYLVGFRWMLDALDVNARGLPRDSHRLLVVKNGPVVARSRVAQREVLGDQVRARAKGANECADDCCE